MKSLNWKYLLTEVGLLVLGLFFALKLDQWSTTQRLEKRKVESLKTVKEELKANQIQLAESADNDSLVLFFQDILPLISREITESSEYHMIEALPTDLERIRKNNPPSEDVNGFYIKDSTQIKGGKYRYRVGFDFFLNLASLYDVAWEASKISGLIERTDFSCTQRIFLAYDMQEDFKKEQEKVANLYTQCALDATALDDFIVHLMLLLKNKEELTEYYERALIALEKCK